ncbi:hypothetical protein FQZ97_1046480 [compost metagenome]
MVDFLVRRVFHGLADIRQLGGQRLSLVERLGADFAGVVHPHQASDMASVFFAQLRVRLHDGGRRSRRMAGERQQGAHGGIGLQQEAVDGRVVAFGGHGVPPEERSRASLAEWAGQVLPQDSRKVA